MREFPPRGHFLRADIFLHTRISSARAFPPRGYFPSCGYFPAHRHKKTCPGYFLYSGQEARFSASLARTFVTRHGTAARMSSPQPGAVGACLGPHVDVRSDTGGLSQSAAAAVRPVAVHPVAARTDRSFVTCHTDHLPRRSLNQSFKKKSSETFLFQSFFHADGSKTALSTGVLQRAPS